MRNYGIPVKDESAIELLQNGKPFVQDVGLVRHGKDQKEEYFHNFAGVGFDAMVVSNARKYKSAGRLSYLYSILGSLLKYRCPDLQIKSIEKTVMEKIFFAFAAIGAYGGGGMKISPDAVTDDGLLDILLIGNLRRGQVLRALPKLFDGTIKHHPKADTFQTETLSINATSPTPALMEADGELIGSGPFEITILKKRLNIIVPGSFSRG